MFALRRRRIVNTEVEIGQRWRTLTGWPYEVEWEVVRIYNDPEGISHVALRQIDDPTSYKTLAAELLLFGTGYAPVSDPS
jgi:hypothetical protein